MRYGTTIRSLILKLALGQSACSGLPQDGASTSEAARPALAFAYEASVSTDGLALDMQILGATLKRFVLSYGGMTATYVDGGMATGISLSNLTEGDVLNIVNRQGITVSGDVEYTYDGNILTSSFSLEDTTSTVSGNATTGFDVIWNIQAKGGAISNSSTIAVVAPEAHQVPSTSTAGIEHTSGNIAVAVDVAHDVCNASLTSTLDPVSGNVVFQFQASSLLGLACSGLTASLIGIPGMGTGTVAVSPSYVLATQNLAPGTHAISGQILKNGAVVASSVVTVTKSAPVDGTSSWGSLGTNGASGPSGGNGGTSCLPDAEPLTRAQVLTNVSGSACAYPSTTRAQAPGEVPPPLQTTLPTEESPSTFNLLGEDDWVDPFPNVPGSATAPVYFENPGAFVHKLWQTLGTMDPGPGTPGYPVYNYKDGWGDDVSDFYAIAFRPNAETRWPALRSSQGFLSATRDRPNWLTRYEEPLHSGYTYPGMFDRYVTWPEATPMMAAEYSVLRNQTAGGIGGRQVNDVSELVILGPDDGAVKYFRIDRNWANFYCVVTVGSPVSGTHPVSGIRCWGVTKMLFSAERPHLVDVYFTVGFDAHNVAGSRTVGGWAQEGTWLALIRNAGRTVLQSGGEYFGEIRSSKVQRSKWAGFLTYDALTESEIAAPDRFTRN